MFNNLSCEKSLWDRGVELVAGVDEVGRGALAGPMVAGGVVLKKSDLLRVQEILTNNDVEWGDFDKTGTQGMYLQIKDSKVLTPKKREVLSDFIIRNCLCYAVYEVPAKEIDDLGISKCTQKAFANVIKALEIPPEHILTDAFPVRAFPEVIQTNIVSGDRVSLTISAASIVAKVYRDKLMCGLGNQSPYHVYGFEKHKGYGTRFHLENIAKHGQSDQHRRTFIHL